jgi:hypothetical protein
MPARRPAFALRAPAAIALALAVASTAAVPASPRPPATTASPAPPALDTLRALAPTLDANVLALALEARDCALQRGIVPAAARLAVIDYSRPSTEPRLWVFDLDRPGLLFTEHVAHGRNSGDNLARRFSNAHGSLQSSLGLFRTAETYVGGNGYSLRMDGLEPGINDGARERAIVMHGAWYVDPAQAHAQGRLGRSLGCPAVRPAVARPVIDSLKEGQLLFAYYPDAGWLRQSRVLGCGAGVAARRTAAR